MSVFIDFQVNFLEYQGTPIKSEIQKCTNVPLLFEFLLTREERNE